MKKYINAAASVISAVSLAFCCVPLDLSAETTAWDGTADTSWYDSTEECFVLSTAQELAGLSQLVNGGNSFEGKTVSLSCDICLSAYNGIIYASAGQTDSENITSMWIPIGTDTPFCGTFDGKGCTVQGLKTADNVYSGLFGNVRDAVIKNINIYEGEVAGTLYSGGIAGYATGTAFINCTNTADVITENEQENIHTGGIAGYAEDCTFNNCTSSGIVKSTATDGEAYCGGIAGYGQLSEFSVCDTASDCLVIATSEGNNSCAGGICGFGAVSIDGCMNEALTAARTSGGVGYSGGIIGLGKGTEGFTKVSRCTNSSTSVLSKASAGYAGGIAGLCAVITDCVNSGVVCAVQGNAQCSIGGIAGGMCDITNCISVGPIAEDSGAGVDTDTEVISGGIAAESFSCTIVNSCYLETTAECASESDETLLCSVTGEELASEEFAKTMGEGFVSAEKGYPIPACCYTTVTGDLDMNGTIDSLDTVIMRRGLTEGFDTVAQRNAADVSGNVLKNSEDISYVRDYLLGEREDFDEVFGFTGVGSNNIFT